jgi:hypothetical protein
MSTYIKQIPWKKSRKFGDIYGGRVRLRVVGNIFQRLHNLQAPSENDELPILIEDNASRDFIFPLSGIEVVEALKALPKKDYKGITHVWLRRAKKSEFDSLPLAEFICGGGVRVIILYPWDKSLTENFGIQKPPLKFFREYMKYNVAIKKSGSSWVCKWNLDSLKKYYVHSLLYHEVGHHVDEYLRCWTKANIKQCEEYADQYAFQKSVTATYVVNNLKDKDKNPV